MKRAAPIQLQMVFFWLFVSRIRIFRVRCSWSSAAWRKVVLSRRFAPSC